MEKKVNVKTHCLDGRNRKDNGTKMTLTTQHPSNISINISQALLHTPFFATDMEYLSNNLELL